MFSGFRSRAAFKLIQLNRKFGFLQQSRVCIDLCAAPGGWMQVARQTMPMSSLVIGVDLHPIKPIPGCINLIGDITTDACRTALSKELKTWKADVVLNDGAPNVGKNWHFDSYQQVCLTLSATKLACEYLRKGGWFITKVFRSKDYNALIWVLKQLFNKVHITKPSASRKESAEIFVVAQNYKAPDKIDPKLFDSKFVFEECKEEPKEENSLKDIVKLSQKKKTKAEGYETAHFSQTLLASEFISSTNPLRALCSAAKIKFDNEEIEKDPLTNEEIKICCSDIQVLGKQDLMLLLNWQKKMNLKLTKPNETVESKSNADRLLENNKEDQKDDEEEEEEEDETHLEPNLSDSVNLLKSKKERKKANKQRAKLVEKLNLKMTVEGDEGPREVADDNVFSAFTFSNQKVEHQINTESLSKEQNIVQKQLWYDHKIFESIQTKEVLEENTKKAKKPIKMHLKEDSIEVDNESDHLDDDKMTDSHQNMSKKKQNKLTDEELAIGVMALRKKKKRDIFDSAWNRYVSFDKNLPEWFVKDEEKVSKANIEIPDQILNQFKTSALEVNARTLKKVMEAKARKKRKRTKMLEKMKKKVQNVLESEDNSSQDKIRLLKRFVNYFDIFFI